MVSDILRRRRFLQATGGATMVGLAGCTGDGDGGSGNGGSTDEGTDSGGTDSGGGDGGTQRLRVGQALNPVRFDPILQFSNPDAIVGNRIYSTIYTYNEQTGVVPELATDMPTVERDGTRYIIEIRDDASFHNGDPVTAEDVEYSVMAPVEEETPLAALFNMIDGSELIDEQTVQFDLADPNALFQDALTHHVVPKSVREEDKEAFNTQNPVGSGPFRFVDWEEGNYVELERWEDYWGKEPELDEVRFEPITESTTRITSLQTGEVDMIETIPPRLWETVEEMGDATIHEEESIGYFYVAFNCNEGPTTDLRVREAIDYCFDMDQAIERFIEPTGLRQYCPLPGPVLDEWGIDDEQWQDIPNDRDIEQAQALFEEAGVPDDWEALIITPPDDNREELGLTIANGIQEAGYDATVQRLDWGAMLNRAYTGSSEDYNLYVLGWVRYPDPDDFMFNLFHEDAETVNQGVFYRNEEVMDQLQEARRTTDRDRRKELYESSITTLLEDKVHLPAFNYKNVYAGKNYVQDFQTHAVSPFNPRLVTDYNNVSVDQ